MKKQTFAFFDLDYTVLPHDTLFLLGNFVLRKQPWRIYYLFFLIPALALFLIGLVGAHGLKRAFLSILAGIPKERLDLWIDEFTDSLVELSFPELRREIDRHKKAGSYLVLNTASPVFYIEPLGKKLGFDRCVGSGFALRDPVPVWIQPTGPNNKNLRKLIHMQDLLPPDTLQAAQQNWQEGDCGRPIPGSHAYTDSTADLPLLAIAEYKHVIAPGKRLRHLAEKSGWTIWEPVLPYQNKWSKAALSIRQMFGLYNYKRPGSYASNP